METANSVKVTVPPGTSPLPQLMGAARLICLSLVLLQWQDAGFCIIGHKAGVKERQGIFPIGWTVGMF